MAAGIHVDRVGKTFRAGSVRALDGVSLEIAPGEAFGIIGPNGAGKTTLFGCILALLRPDSGTITIDGHAPDDVEVRATTGYLPERLVMDRWMTGREFLAYHHALARLPDERRDEDVDAVLERVGLEPEAAGRSIRRYSHGMLRRVGLAQALLGAPRYLFLDEPASGVDPAGVVRLRRLFEDLKGKGVTIILNSHQLDQVERVCDRVAFVSRGRVQAIETMTAGTQVAHVLRVRWAASLTHGAVTEERLGLVAAEAGATLRGAAGIEARFEVANEEAAARVVRGLVAAGIAVAEAEPEESRLERLFTGDAGGTPS